MYLDADSLSVLRAQCKKLVKLSASTSAWAASEYGPYLRVSTEHTLAELRRHWSLYDAMQDLPATRLAEIRHAFSRAFSRSTGKTWVPMTSNRSSGPLIDKATEPAAAQVKNYWKTGTTFTSPKQVSAAKLLNPTFAYSLDGEGCAVHYGTDPLVAFHAAALFANASGNVRAADLVQSAQAECAEWCAAFRRRSSDALRIRFCLSEATVFCRALTAFRETGTLALGIPIAQWKTQQLRLSSDEYKTEKAPAKFNVVDTSNLIDYIGLLNILIATLPLLSPAPSTVLYTESLTSMGEDATKQFAQLLYADIGTVGLLLDICPVDYLSGFSSSSNTHELIMYMGAKAEATQYHNVTTWKSPASCDSAVAFHGGRPCLPPVYDPRQLGTLLFDVYHALFEQEDSRTFLAQNRNNLLGAIATSNLIHYMRESFTMLLRLVRERLRVPRERWFQVMDRFLGLEETDQTMPMNTVNRNDLYAHLHRQGVHTMDAYRHVRVPRIGPFAQWDAVPPVVRIVLSVPRERVRAFESVLRTSNVATPPMQCDVRGGWSHNIFNAVHVAFGRVLVVGTQARPRVLFEEDPDERRGVLPLVVTFCVPALLLTNIEAPSALEICLSVRSTTGTMPLVRTLGLRQEVFSARLMDDEHVHVFPEPSLPAADFEELPRSLLSPNSTLHTEIGAQRVPVVELDEQCEFVQSLSSRVSIEDSSVVREFGSAGAIPQITQLSPCCMRLFVAGRSQDVVYPFPVVGSQNKLRLARKSLYIEVVVPIAGPFLKPDGMKLNPFPVIGAGKALHSWNIHRVSLSKLPILDPNAPKRDRWLNTHVGSMLSTRERKMRKKRRADALMFVKDTIHTIFVRSTGVQRGAAQRVMALRDEQTNNCDTLFFIADVRFDLHAHTLVCDGYVLPLTHDVMPRIEGFFGKLVSGGDMVNVTVFEGEMQAWKQLIPAFVERCRTWKHEDGCEYLKRRQAPLTIEMEADPLCGCGRGKDVNGLRKVAEWRKYAPYVTRIAIAPLFAVSYLETVGRDPTAYKCSVCRGRGDPKLKACKGCLKVRYCSQACQKKDWPRHKDQCKA